MLKMGRFSLLRVPSDWNSIRLKGIVFRRRQVVVVVEVTSCERFQSKWQNVCQRLAYGVSITIVVILMMIVGFTRFLRGSFLKIWESFWWCLVFFLTSCSAAAFRRYARSTSWNRTWFAKSWRSAAGYWSFTCSSNSTSSISFSSPKQI